MAPADALSRPFFERRGKASLAKDCSLFELAAAEAEVRSILIRRSARFAESPWGRLIHLRERQDVEDVELGLVHGNPLGLPFRDQVQRDAIE